MIDNAFSAWLVDRFGEAVKMNEPMSRHTSLRVGGPADVLVSVNDEAGLKALVQECGRRQVPWLVVSGGTNLLVKDQGIRGVVIDMTRGMAGIETIKLNDETAHVMARSGTRLPSFCNHAIVNGYGGMAFALGIPGTVGGAVKMNAGTSRGTMMDVVDAVEIMNADGTIQKKDQAALVFSYRGFAVKTEKHEMTDGFLILKAFFSLPREKPEVLRREAKAVLQQRSERQPAGSWSAGCFFRNPQEGPSAGALIDAAGLKGRTKGGAAVSDKHANFIINTGQATAADILELMTLVQQTVADHSGTKLEPEVQIVGE
ncbi:MAG: UDP-N-acetylmuramate dehydrogenase [Thermodesulfobacteriota bacterium]|nr:UDP-N-acetylmuramate dehydrogenase [Thermodesulfobacteriota bacterium]